MSSAAIELAPPTVCRNASVLDEFEEPRRACITFQARGIRSHVKVGNNIAKALGL